MDIAALSSREYYNITLINMVWSLIPWSDFLWDCLPCCTKRRQLFSLDAGIISKNLKSQFLSSLRPGAFLLYNPSSSVTQPNESYGVFFFACNEFRILGWIIAAVVFSFHCDFLYRSLGWWFSWNKFLCKRWSTVRSLEVFRFSRKQVSGRSLRWIIQITKSKWNKLYWSSLSRTSEVQTRC